MGGTGRLPAGPRLKEHAAGGALSQAHRNLDLRSHPHIEQLQGRRRQGRAGGRWNECARAALGVRQGMVGGTQRANAAAAPVVKHFLARPPGCWPALSGAAALRTPARSRSPPLSATPACASWRCAGTALRCAGAALCRRCAALRYAGAALCRRWCAVQAVCCAALRWSHRDAWHLEQERAAPQCFDHAGVKLVVCLWRQAHVLIQRHLAAAVLQTIRVGQDSAAPGSSGQAGGRAG